MGEIGLPDIQRPFVWKNAKVRDLFNSMYRGYPVGYLLLWQNGFTDDHRERFYIRTGASTSELVPSQMTQYLKQRFEG